MSSETPTSASYRTAGWLIWLALTVAISFTVIISIARGQERSVTPAYRSAVENWFAGRPLYNMEGHGFLYLPQAALTFAPWAMLPYSVGELTWRWFIIGVLAASVARLTRLINGDGRWFFAISASTAVLAWGCARNGQSTLLITGMMIFAVADLSEARWWRASFLLVMAFAFKPLVIVLILLAAVVHPQSSWRMALGLFVIAIAPFATQRTDYVLSQFQACYQSLHVTFEVGESQNWHQLFSTLRVAGIEIPSVARTAIRLLAAVATLGVCWQVARRLSPQKSAFYLFSMAACYLMLFNSRTEGSTYAMVGPVYGALLAEAAFQLKHRAAAAWMIAAVVLSILNFELGILLTPRENAIWICPLVCVGVTAYLLLRIIRELRTASLALEDSALSGDFPTSVPHCPETRNAGQMSVPNLR